MLCGISTPFGVLSPSVRQVAHALLTRPPLGPSRKTTPVRLACIRHAASVHPEPGSNSSIQSLNSFSSSAQIPSPPPTCILLRYAPATSFLCTQTSKSTLLFRNHCFACFFSQHYIFFKVPPPSIRQPRQMTFFAHLAWSLE